jgi:hypothetical protein
VAFILVLRVVGVAVDSRQQKQLQNVATCIACLPAASVAFDWHRYVIA